MGTKGVKIRDFALMVIMRKPYEIGSSRSLLLNWNGNEERKERASSGAQHQNSIKAIL